MEIQVKNFRQMLLSFFGGTENRNGIELYHLQNTGFSLSFDLKPGPGNPNKWYRKFRLFRLKWEKGNTSKGITFFPENFDRDEPFHLNSPRNFRVFHTNGKCTSFSPYKQFTRPRPLQKIYLKCQLTLQVPNGLRCMR